ncbi:MAG: deoxynucleoside kinase, partial [Sediminibacterium sp.]|nr:deoxynucleoside kinase [Sediminibacterium sp.]
MTPTYIAIEGNIGVGKTTLATLLATKLNATLILEEFADNPFLQKFYENPKQYAFSLELSFMAERYKQQKEKIKQTDLFEQLYIADYMFSKS